MKKENDEFMLLQPAIAKLFPKVELYSVCFAHLIKVI